MSDSIVINSFIKKDQTFTLPIITVSNIIINNFYGKHVQKDNLPEKFFLIIYGWEKKKFNFMKELFYKYTIEELRKYNFNETKYFDVIKEFFYKYNIEELGECNVSDTKYFYLERRPVNTKCAIK